MPAVKAIFLRMSATWKAFRIVESMGFQPAAPERGARVAAERPILVDAPARAAGCTAGAQLAVDDLAAAAGRLDPSPGARAEGVRVHRERLAELALGEHLDG